MNLIFMSYPWGREAFSSTLERFGPDLGDPNPIAELKKQFCQRTSVWYGFPFVLQVQVLNSISSLCSRIKDLTDMRNFINRSSVDLGKTILLRESVVVEVECDANLSIGYTLIPSIELNEKDFCLSKENDDPMVEHMLGLISKGHRFHPNQWPFDATPVQPTNTEENPGGNRGPSPGLAETSEAHSIPEMSAKTKEPKNSSFPHRKPFTRSASKSGRVVPSNLICNPPSKKSKHKGSAAFVDGSHPRVADMEKIVESKSASLKSGVRPSRKLKTSVSKKSPPSVSRKRQRVEVQSLSPATSEDVVQDGGFHAPSFDSPFNTNLPTTEGYGDAKSISQNLCGDFQEPPLPIKDLDVDQTGDDPMVSSSSPLPSPIILPWPSSQDQTVGDPMVTANSPLPSPKIPMAPSDQVFGDVDELYCNLSAINPVSLAYFLHETINIRQPVLQKRVPIRSRYLDTAQYNVDARISALFKSRTKKPPYMPLATLDELEFQNFESLLQEDTEQTSGCQLRRRAKAYALKRVTIIDTWFLALLMTHHEDFMKCQDKENYNWGSSLKAYGSYHWVVLVINLQLRTVLIVDPFSAPFPDEQVAVLIKPVTELLPWLLKRFAMPALTEHPTPSLGP
ncbi:Ulp1 protease family C-terminal catalytic domain [Arabidopsis suecica]|uniref:Ulp1 protease family C-terminal catalytic domain n=1 Tax=Arabidopsis suecica TaxID=45249 RepID=A0A8T2GBX8_ARASU|nr:Ulp1 protease family C-terminal catalytic domain [Arabidopsis suecica]